MDDDEDCTIRATYVKTPYGKFMIDHTKEEWEGLEKAPDVPPEVVASIRAKIDAGKRELKRLNEARKALQ